MNEPRPATDAEETIARLTRERDELAATVERLTKALGCAANRIESIMETEPHLHLKDDLAMYRAALSSTPAQNLAKVRAEGWRAAARHCEETELLMPVPSPGTTLRQHGANVCMALAAELRAEADRIEAEAAR